MMTVQGVFINMNTVIKKHVRLGAHERKLHLPLVNAKDFVDKFISHGEVLEITTYAELFVGVIYCHQYKVATDDESYAVSVKSLVA